MSLLLYNMRHRLRLLRPQQAEEDFVRAIREDTRLARRKAAGIREAAARARAELLRLRGEMAAADADMNADADASDAR